MGQSYLAEDLITDIISRVSAKNLLRFKCVSKSWRSLIHTDPYLSRLQCSASGRTWLFIQGCVKPAFRSWLFNHHLIDLDSIEDQSMNLREIRNPFDQSPRKDTKVLASCHDLLVLQIRHPKKYVVSNPITGKHVMVPPNPAGDDNVVFFGFGFDRVHDCYKLLTRVIKHRDQALELMVYDLGKGTWKRLQFGMWWKSEYEASDDADSGCIYSRWDHCCAKWIDGGLYWCFYIGRPSKMVCFLLAEEEFYMVKPPGPGQVTRHHPYTLTVFDGKLGLVCRGLNAEHEFWSIRMDRDDDGKIQWRWTKLLVISDVPPYFQAYDFLTPVCFSACKNKILILSRMKSRLFWYDIVKELNNPISGCCQDGKLLRCGMVKEEIHKFNELIDGVRFSCFNMF